MKAIVKNVGNKKIIGINVEEYKIQLEQIAEMNGCKFELAENNCGDFTLGELSGEDEKTTKESKTVIEDSILIFSGLGGRNLDRLLNMLRMNNVLVSLKAVVTQYNRKWTVSKLRDEIKKEHELMNGLNGGGQNEQ